MYLSLKSFPSDDGTITLSTLKEDFYLVFSKHFKYAFLFIGQLLNCFLHAFLKAILQFNHKLTFARHP